MFHILVQRLSGLLNRRIFWLPFSRSTDVDQDWVHACDKILRTCREEGGVLLATPEHMLSFRLMGIEHFCKQSSTADHLGKVQKWLDSEARDILDESDEILDVRYQMIYTIGQQRALEATPDRWTVVQEVLSILKSQAISDVVQGEFEIEACPSQCFPCIRILD